MRKYAFLAENVVTKIESLGDDNLDFSSYQLVLDIEDLIVQPQVGWILNGNHLVPPPSEQANIKEIIKATIKHYQSVAPELLRDMYATNTLLGITAAQSDNVFREYADVLLMLTQGAFPTAIYRLQQKEPSGFVTQEMLDAWILKIQQAMVQ